MTPRRPAYLYRYPRTAAEAFRDLDSDYRSAFETPTGERRILLPMPKAGNDDDVAFAAWSELIVTRLCAWGLLAAVAMLMLGMLD